MNVKSLIFIDSALKTVNNYFPHLMVNMIWCTCFFIILTRWAVIVERFTHLPADYDHKGNSFALLDIILIIEKDWIIIVYYELGKAHVLSYLIRL